MAKTEKTFVEQLADLIPDYPDQTDPNLPSILAHKQEFFETKAIPSEPNPPPGGLYSHQKLFSRLMRIYPRMLLLADPGTGKTVSFLAASEYLRETGIFRKCFVLEKSPTVLDAVIKQLFDNLQPEEWMDPDLVNTSEARSSGASIGKLLSTKPPSAAAQSLKHNALALRRRAGTFYAFMTYGQFTNELTKLNLSDEELKSYFGNTILIADEFHNAVSDPTSTKYKLIHRISNLVSNMIIILATSTPMINKISELGNLGNCLLPADRHFPANFDYSDLDEIGRRFQNFISYVRADTVYARLEYRGQTLASALQEFESRRSATSEMARISRMEIQEKTSLSLSPSQIDKLEKNSGKAENSIRVVVSEMGDFQTAGYARIKSSRGGEQSEKIEKRGKKDDEEFDETGLGELDELQISNDVGDVENTEEIGDEEAEEADRSNAIWNRSLQASMFVFPDLSFGGIVSGGDQRRAEDKSENSVLEGLEKYVEVIPVGGSSQQRGNSRKNSSEQLSYRFRRSIPDFSGWATSVNLSPSITFREWIGGAGRPINTPKTYNLNRCSSKYAASIDIELKNASEPGTSFVYIEQKNGGGTILYGLCLEAFGYERMVVPADGSLPSRLSNGKYRYAILTSAPETPRALQEKILKIVNSPENVDGQICKVIVSSRVARDGISIFHARRMQSLRPVWTEMGFFQAMMRVFRANSHIDLVQFLLQRNAERGFPQTESEVRRSVTVEIYRHVAIPPTSRTELISADLHVHSISAKKDTLIRPIMRMLKRSSIDCELNYERNVVFPAQLGFEVDGSAECDYQRCVYSCRGKKCVIKTSQASKKCSSSPEQIFSETQISLLTYNLQPTNDDWIEVHQAILNFFATRFQATFAEIDSILPKYYKLTRKTCAEMADNLEVIWNDLGQRCYLIAAFRSGLLEIPDFFLTFDVDRAAMCNTFPKFVKEEYSRSLKPVVIFERDFRNSMASLFAEHDSEIVEEEIFGGGESNLDPVKIRRSVSRMGSSLNALKLYEQALVEIRAGSDNPIFKKIIEALDPFYHNKIRQSTVGSVLETYQSLIGTPANPTTVFPGIDPDSEIFFNVTMMLEERRIVGEHTSAIRGGLTAADAIGSRDPTAQLIRVWLPAESLRDPPATASHSLRSHSGLPAETELRSHSKLPSKTEQSEVLTSTRSGGWRWVTQPYEGAVIEAKWSENSRKMLRGVAGSSEVSSEQTLSTFEGIAELHFYGRYDQSTNKLRIIDKLVRKKPWGRVCSTFLSGDLVYYILMLDPNFDVRELLKKERVNVNMATYPDSEEKWTAFVALLLPVLQKYIREKEGGEKSLEEAREKVWWMLKIPSLMMCSTILALMKRRGVVEYI